MGRDISQMVDCQFFLSRRPGFSSSVLRVRLVVVSVTFGRFVFNPAASPCQLPFYHALYSSVVRAATPEAVLPRESLA